MNALDESVVVPLLQIAGVGLALWLCLPHLLTALGVLRVQGGVHGGPEEALPEKLCGQLATLGFQRAGTYWEKCATSRTFLEHAFFRKEGDVFAAVYQLFGSEWPRVAFLTTFNEGGAVFTPNYEGGADGVTDDFHAGGIPEAPLSEVLDEHLRRLQNFRDRGHLPMPAKTIEDFVDSQRVYNAHPASVRALRRAELAHFVFDAVKLLIVPAVLVRFFGFDHPMPWAALLGIGLLSLGMRRVLDRLLEQSPQGKSVMDRLKCDGEPWT